MREQEFQPEAVTPEVMARNRPTLENVRLWDYRPLLSAYRQLQVLRQYYIFGDVDIDRYRFGGAQRIGARPERPGLLGPSATSVLTRRS